MISNEQKRPVFGKILPTDNAYSEKNPQQDSEYDSHNCPYETPAGIRYGIFFFAGQVFAPSVKEWRLEGKP